MKLKLYGDWTKATAIMNTMNDKFIKAADQAILVEANYLRAQAIKNITSGGSHAGAPFAPLSPATIAIRRFTGFGGSKILMRTGSLRNSIIVKKVGKAVFVGIQRGGGKGVNLAEVHEFGANISMVMTPRQRRFLMAAFRAYGGASGPGKGGGGVLVIKIPARPFMGPTFNKFAKPEDVRKRFWAHVSKAMGGDLGK